MWSFPSLIDSVSWDSTLSFLRMSICLVWYELLILKLLVRFNVISILINAILWLLWYSQWWEYQVVIIKRILWHIIILKGFINRLIKVDSLKGLRLLINIFHLRIIELEGSVEVGSVCSFIRITLCMFSAIHITLSEKLIDSMLDVLILRYELQIEIISLMIFSFYANRVSLKLPQLVQIITLLLNVKFNTFPNVTLVSLNEFLFHMVLILEILIIHQYMSEGLSLGLHSDWEFCLILRNTSIFLVAKLHIRFYCWLGDAVVRGSLTLSGLV